jgi:hypothetical protein
VWDRALPGDGHERPAVIMDLEWPQDRDPHSSILPAGTTPWPAPQRQCPPFRHNGVHRGPAHVRTTRRSKRPRLGAKWFPAVTEKPIELAQ